MAKTTMILNETANNKTSQRLRSCLGILKKDKEFETIRKNIERKMEQKYDMIWLN